jgi:16S rRNA (cytidine1402-2'-O)-methyltransferase
MPGILYVVATPIGNLEDVTFRAVRVLSEVSLIAAEDTRRTARLLQHYSIPTPTTSLHEHNERAKTPGLIERLKRGDSVALVSDAGTPVVSDPGAHLVAEAHRAGITVEPVPGASAVMAVLSASGLAPKEFLFVGFPPSRSKARGEWLRRLARDPRPIVLFESPHRIRALLVQMLDVLGDRPITVGRELTKAHENLVNRPISAHLEALGHPKGEFALVIHPGIEPEMTSAGDVQPSQLAQEFWDLTNNAGLSRRAALKSVAATHGVGAREVYRAVEAHKGGSSDR